MATEQQKAERWWVECTTCDEIDTYGDEEFLKLGQDHADENPGHVVRVEYRRWSALVSEGVAAKESERSDG